MASSLSLYLRAWNGIEIIPVLFLTAAAIPTSVVIWGVAYGFWSDDP